MNAKRMTAAALFVLLGLMGAAMAVFIPQPQPQPVQPATEQEPADIPASYPAAEVLAPTEKPPEKTEPEPKETVQFWIKAHGDTVAVFGEADMETPMRITNIRVSSLRRDDQKMLQEGIPAEDEESLWMLIEDFGP